MMDGDFGPDITDMTKDIEYLCSLLHLTLVLLYDLHTLYQHHNCHSYFMTSLQKRSMKFVVTHVTVSACVVVEAHGC